MKAKIKIGLLGLLFTNLLTVSAQTDAATVVANDYATAVGVQNGAIPPNYGGNYSTFFGFQAGQSNINKDLGADNTFVGNQSGRATTSGSRNSFLGSISGINNISGSDNVFVGWGAGVNSNANWNTFLGRSAGPSNTSGEGNTFVGSLSGRNNLNGSANVFVGFGAGNDNIGGGNNVAIGYAAGSTFNAWGNSIYGAYAGQYSTGNGNVFFGQNAGRNSLSGNVMIGYSAGENAAVSNKLYIDNNSTTTPTIYGDFTTKKVGIGGVVNTYNTADGFPATAGTVSLADYKLFVKGGILTEEVRVSLTSTWADYVFSKNYNLKPLAEVEKFITDNGHLPNVPSAKQVKEEGIELGNMSKIQQEKIEELTLYVIQQNKNTEELTLSLIQQKKEIEELKAQVKVLIEKNK